MSHSEPERIVSADAMAAIAASAGGPVPFFHWPERGRVFAERSMRLRQRAQDHAMGDFLRFAAELAQVQHEALQRRPPVPLPTTAQLQQAAVAGLPPLPAADWPRDAAWRVELRRMLPQLRRDGLPPSVRATLEGLAQASDEVLERQADCLLTGVMHGLDLATAPLVAAALQVYWTYLVLSLREQAATLPLSGPDAPFVRTADASTCPCCGSRPTAAMTRSAGGIGGQRYLHCSLCSTQWALPRLQCAHCHSDEPVYYQSLEVIDSDAGVSRAARAAVQAECCDACGHYLKIVHAERDALVDPAADDLASLTLDLLVSEAGLQRHGVNLMLLFGEPEVLPSSRPPQSSPLRPGAS